MSFPYARTYDEVHLYLSLRPCVCGEGEFDELSSDTGLVGGVLVERFTGTCLGCARLREFTFQMSDRPREVSFDIRYGLDDEPSRLIDAGEWLAVSELYGQAATEELDGEPLEDPDDVERLLYTVTSAIAALDEVAKFIPAGADVVPEGAFWTPAGRMLWEAEEARFTREALAADRERLLGRLAVFERRYGVPDGPPPGGSPGGGVDRPS
ncbi:hypothetical protein [Cryptosporangium minutisporangium]|uniref:Uncharacterized protein n=1 Tax=Cryptosporangium minutisporangium TaxID=113569 RepID=A0ABP6TAU2_9ACTN